MFSRVTRNTLKLFTTRSTKQQVFQFDILESKRYANSLLVQRALTSTAKQATKRNVTRVLFGVGATSAACYVTATLFNNNSTLMTAANQITQSLTAEAEEKLTSLAQPTPFSEGNQHAAYVTVHLAYGADPKQVAAAAANIQKIVEKVSPVSTEERINGEGAVGGVAFSPEFWQRLTQQVSGLSQPRNARTYHTRSSTNGGMPATGGEVFVHIKAKTRGLAFEIVNEFLQSLPAGSVAKVEDIYGWVFQDNRDLSGFIDGTMNVTGEEDRADESLIGNEDKAHRGGSYIMTQRWLHNLKALHSRSVKEQEQVIGRTKDFSAELDPLPKSSHVHRTSSRLVLDEKGREVKIVRQSMPFGDHSGLHGLFFIAYSNNPAKFDKLLDRMTGLEDGVADATFTFSTCDRGQYWYLPNLAELNALRTASKK